MKKIVILFILVLGLAPLNLFSYNEVSALDELIEKNYDWDIGFSTYYFYEPDLLNDGSVIQGFSHNIKGYYNLENKYFLGGSFFFAETYKSDLTDKWLTVIGDISLEGMYKFFAKNNINLYAKSILYLFAPVPGESTLADTSSYYLSLLGTYNFKPFTIKGSLGYFYDRRINLSKTAPTPFERLSWNDVGYTWTPFSLKLLFDAGRTDFGLSFKSLILYGDSIILPSVNSVINVSYDITDNIYIKGGIDVCLYGKKTDYYPDYPKFRYLLALFYHPIGREKIEQPVKQETLPVETSVKKGTVHIVVKNRENEFILNPTITIEGYSAVPEVLKEGEIIYYLNPGNYTLTVTATGYKKKTVSLTISQGEEKTLNIILNKKIRYGGITGLVTSDHKPIKNIFVKVLNYPDKITKTDNSGMFVIKNIPEGTHEITFYDHFYKPVTTFVEVLPNETVVVNQSLEMKKFKHGNITLKVIDKTSKKEIEDYKITVESKIFKVSYGENGEAEIITYPGKVTVYITAKGYKKKRKIFYIDEDDEVEYTIKLSKLK